MATTRTFKLDNPPMTGDDIKSWQQDLRDEFKKMDIDAPIVNDGVYGPNTRSFTAQLCEALGLSAIASMKNGVTPHLRSKLRNQDLTPAQKKTFDSAKTKKYRAELRKRYARANSGVHLPCTKILAHSWGFHPGVHDGLDIICLPDVPIFAMIKSRVIDVRSSSWWGLGAPNNPALKAKGDGIIQLEVLESIGPFEKGQHIGYGHAEKANVAVGDVVPAGHPIGHAGFANAWHIHLMLNDGSTTKGIGNLDPAKIIDYVIKHA